MSDQPPQVPARRDRREAVREKAAQVHAKQRRSRVIRLVSLSVVVVAVLATAGVVVTTSLVAQANKPDASPAGVHDDAIVVQEVPAAVLASFGSSVDPDDAPSDEAEPEPSTTAAAPVTIDVYVDYMSEDSAEFQKGNAKQLAEWVTQGSAALAYHPVALLTAKSNGTKYSVRAAGSVACVATYSPEAFFAFNHELLTKMPEQDTDGYSDSQLADMAIASGASDPKAIRRCIEDQDFVAWAQKATARALNSPVGSTDEPLAGPAVLVDGNPYIGDLEDPKEFAQFVLTLSSTAYFSTPTPEPTTSGSPEPAESATPDE